MTIILYRTAYSPPVDLTVSQHIITIRLKVTYIIITIDILPVNNLFRNKI